MIGPVTPSSSGSALAIEENERVFSTQLRAHETHRGSYSTLHTHDVGSDNWGGLPEDQHPNGRPYRLASPETLATAIRGLLGGSTHVTTVHNWHSPETVRTSDTTATSIWPMKDRQGRHRGIALWFRPLPLGVSANQRAVTDQLPQAHSLAGGTQPRILQLSNTARNHRPP